MRACSVLTKGLIDESDFGRRIDKASRSREVGTVDNVLADLSDPAAGEFLQPDVPITLSTSTTSTRFESGNRSPNSSACHAGIRYVSRFQDLLFDSAGDEPSLDLDNTPAVAVRGRNGGTSGRLLDEAAMRQAMRQRSIARLMALSHRHFGAPTMDARLAKCGAAFTLSHRSHAVRNSRDSSSLNFMGASFRSAYPPPESRLFAIAGSLRTTEDRTGSLRLRWCAMPGDIDPLPSLRFGAGAKKLRSETAGIQPRDLKVLGTDNTPSGEQIWLRFVDLHRNLHEEAGRVALANELRQLIVDGLSDPQEVVAA